VDTVKPVLEKLVVLEVLISANPVQLAPEQRSILYPVTPTLSVDAVHPKLICVEDAAVAVSPLGAEGLVVSAAPEVVAELILEYPLRFPAASDARTR
jgi:2-polyprenyl-6-methoxyphenol hydroxylase-like FAD-dependent oxidoreductase